MPETLMLKTTSEKEQCLNEMMKYLEDAGYEPEGRVYGFEGTLSVMKYLDKEYENKGLTDVHPSRYLALKLIEKAEVLLEKEEN